MGSVGRSLVAALVLFFSATSAWAQATAQLGGTVRDESGAVLPGVTVTATQTDTGFTRTVVKEGSGAYVITNLQQLQLGRSEHELRTGTFGQITSQSGDPRIMRFGVKYGF